MERIQEGFYFHLSSQAHVEEVELKKHFGVTSRIPKTKQYRKEEVFELLLRKIEIN